MAGMRGVTGELRKLRNEELVRLAWANQGWQTKVLGLNQAWHCIGK